MHHVLFSLHEQIPGQEAFEVAVITFVFGLLLHSAAAAYVMLSTSPVGVDYITRETR
jgi:hypothetical protein